MPTHGWKPKALTPAALLVITAQGVWLHRGAQCEFSFQICLITLPETFYGSQLEPQALCSGRKGRSHKAEYLWKGPHDWCTGQLQEQARYLTFLSKWILIKTK